MNAVAKIVGKDGVVREIPRASLVAKMGENVARILGERPLRVVCDVCAKVIPVPMKSILRGSCLALIRSLDIDLGGNEAVKTLRDIIEQSIQKDRSVEAIRDAKESLRALRKIPKRCEEHYWCPGAGDGKPCPKAARLSRHVYFPNCVAHRKAAVAACHSCSSRRAKAAMTPEKRSEAARKGNAAMTPEKRSEAVRKGNAAMTPEKRSEAVRKAWASRRQNQK